MASNLVQVVKRFLIFVVVVGLCGVVFWLLSERHGRMWGVEKKEDSLWIVRGREMPFGFYVYQPTDRLLADAYAPIPWSGEPLGDLLNTTFEDRNELDRAIFKVLKGWMEARLESDDPEKLKETLHLVKRAELLSGIDSQQRQELKDIQARVSYFEGWLLLREAEEALRNGVERLKLAAGAHSKYSREASEIVERVKELSERLSRSLRLPLTSSELGYTPYRTPKQSTNTKMEAEKSLPPVAPTSAAPSSSASDSSVVPAFQGKPEPTPTVTEELKADPTPHSPP